MSRTKRSSQTQPVPAFEERGLQPDQSPGVGSSEPVRVHQAVRYTRPKIILIDLQPEVTTALSEAGYDVDEGSFGRPYHVTTKGAQSVPVVLNGRTPGLPEKEILVVDLEPGEPLSDPPPANHLHEPGWWTEPRAGIVDPRPVAMGTTFSRFADRIFEHDGLVVVFAALEQGHQYDWAHVQHRSLVHDNAQPSTFSNWSLLSFLFHGFETSFDVGEEVLIERANTPLHNLLRKFTSGLHFRCTIRPKSYVQPAWLPLATNKFGGCVSGAITQKGKYKILIFPRVTDQAKFSCELFQSVLPELVPHLSLSTSERGGLRIRDTSCPASSP
jgi:hypothetical protein